MIVVTKQILNDFFEWFLKFEFVLFNMDLQKQPHSRVLLFCVTWLYCQPILPSPWKESSCIPVDTQALFSFLCSRGASVSSPIRKRKFVYSSRKHHGGNSLCWHLLEYILRSGHFFSTFLLKFSLNSFVHSDAPWEQRPGHFSSLYVPFCLARCQSHGRQPTYFNCMWMKDSPGLAVTETDRNGSEGVVMFRRDCWKYCGC